MRLRDTDRILGESIRVGVTRAGGAPAAAAAASTLGPAFRILVGASLLRSSTRRFGLVALASSVVAAATARALRDAIGRPRPRGRAGGSLPSRHAAAASAIAAAARGNSPHSSAVAAAAASGLAGRVVTGDHDPADILAGVALGGAVAWMARWVFARIPDR